LSLDGQTLAWWSRGEECELHSLNAAAPDDGEGVARVLVARSQECSPIVCAVVGPRRCLQRIRAATFP
jgi:hypothetical protein